MTTGSVGVLNIEGELTAEYEGVRTVVTGSGSLLRWDLVDPDRLVRSGGLPGRTEVRRAARILRPLGLTLWVGAGDGPLLEIGAVRSNLGGLLFGTRAVRPRSVWRLGRLAWSARR